jgi:uncharacterized membrane protein
VISLIALIWILFFPNAPYVLTDLIHLGIDKSAPRWFDLILLLSYGFTGMLYGFISLRNIEQVLKRHLKPLTVTFIAVVMIYLSCFGIYLGRFLRWNSWDIVNNTEAVLRNVFSLIINPLDNPTTWIFTILFGTLLNLVYFGYKAFGQETELPRQ